jgi:hypothetical protein
MFDEFYKEVRPLYSQRTHKFGVKEISQKIMTQE